MNLNQILLAGLGGCLGSMCRYWVSTVSYRLFGPQFPYGTLVVNVTGSFLIGFLMTFFEERFLVTPGLRIFLTIGILGGFTTFSSFSFETISLLREGSYWIGSMNILFSVVTCLAATWLGIVTGKIL